MSMAGTRKVDNGLSKFIIKKEEMEETDYINDDKWLKKWSCEDVKEEKIPNNGGGVVKLIAIKRENNDSGSACEREMDEKLEKVKEETSTVSKDRERIQVTNKVSLKIDALIKKLCQGAPTSEDVRSLSQFQCKECGKLVTSWGSLNTHVWKCHKNTNVNMTDLEILTVKVVSHICKVCKEPTLCDRPFIRRHLKTHQLNVSQYVEDFKLSSGKIQQGASIFEYDIGNFCVYKCNVCGHKFTNKRAFNRHQLNIHKRKLTSNECFVKKVYHNCKLCGASILCEQSNLNLHFKRMHDDIPLEDYCKLSGCKAATEESIRFPIKRLCTYQLSDTAKNLCEFTCRSCSKTFHSSRTFQWHAKRYHPGVPQRLTSCITKGFSYQCKLCQSLLLCDRATITAHIKKQHGKKCVKENIEYNELYESFINATPTASKIWHETSITSSLIPVQEMSSKIGNLCVYKCPKCDSNNIKCWQKFKYHFKKKHSKSLVFSTNLVVTARYHSCLSCPISVLSDRYFLQNHVKGKHNMSILTYQKTFQRNGGDVLPRMREWFKNPEKHGYTSVLDMNKVPRMRPKLG